MARLIGGGEKIAHNTLTRFAESRLSIALVCTLLAIAIGTYAGQDANWDLQNYHYYNAHAWLTGRYDIDWFPAQMQTGFNPVADLPYALMVDWGFPSWLFTAILSLPAALATFLCVELARRLFSFQETPILALLLPVLLLTGSIGFGTVGTTMSEWHSAAMLMGALLLVLRSVESPPARLSLLFFAGLLGGCAVGIKLTNGVYAIALAIAVVACGPSPKVIAKRLCALAAGGILGTAVFFLPWGLEMFNRYGSPTFPLLNNVFQAPLAEPISFADSRYRPSSLWDALVLPAKLVFTNVSLVGEMHFRDARLALGLPLSLAALFLLWRRRHPRFRPFAVVFAFTMSGYLIWWFAYSIYRYMLPVELLMNVMIVSGVLLAAAQLRRQWQMFMLVATTVFVAWFTVPTDWDRAPHGNAAVRVDLSHLPRNAMVVFATLWPDGFIAANLPSNVPAISVINNFTHDVWPNRRLQETALAKMRAHAGPVFLLTRADQRNERFYDDRLILDEMLVPLGFIVSNNNCLDINTRMRRSLRLCPLEQHQAAPLPAH
jgi:hypothetical protein